MQGSDDLPQLCLGYGHPHIQVGTPSRAPTRLHGQQVMINYGVKCSIVFRNKHVEEYFDVANIDHYDVILGMPFLWQLGVTLDFTGQGAVCISMYVVPMNTPSESSNDMQWMVTSKPPRPQPKPPE